MDLVKAKDSLEPFQELQRSWPAQLKLQRLDNSLLEIDQVFVCHVIFLPTVDHIDHVLKGRNEWLIKFGRQ